MTLATLSACLPFPHPDASAETLQQLLSERKSSSSSSSPRSRDRRDESLAPPYASASSSRMAGMMVSLGPVARRRRGLLLGEGKGRVAAGVGDDVDARVFCRQTVWRGFTAPRNHQLHALEQVTRLLRFCGHFSRLFWLRLRTSALSSCGRLLSVGARVGEHGVNWVYCSVDVEGMGALNPPEDNHQPSSSGTWVNSAHLSNHFSYPEASFRNNCCPPMPLSNCCLAVTSSPPNRLLAPAAGPPYQRTQQVLRHSGVGSGGSYSVSTPLPIPITYPLLFRESLGLRGELPSTPVVKDMPLPPSQSGPFGGVISTSASAGSGGGEAGAGAGEMRVMCDQISGAACAERGSAMGSFLGQVRSTSDRSRLRIGHVYWALDKRGA